jgi:hypothetical protein
VTKRFPAAISAERAYSKLCGERASLQSAPLDATAPPKLQWLKTKGSAILWTITSYHESAPGAREAVRIAELVAGELRDAGEVRIRLAAASLKRCGRSASPTTRRT